MTNLRFKSLDQSEFVRGKGVQKKLGIGEQIIEIYPDNEKCVSFKFLFWFEIAR